MIVWIVYCCQKAPSDTTYSLSSGCETRECSAHALVALAEDVGSISSTDMVVHDYP